MSNAEVMTVALVAATFFDNWYNYADNNPLGKVDPEGLSPTSAVDIVRRAVKDITKAGNDPAGFLKDHPGLVTYPSDAAGTNVSAPACTDCSDFAGRCAIAYDPKYPVGYGVNDQWGYVTGQGKHKGEGGPSRWTHGNIDGNYIPKPGDIVSHPARPGEHHGHAGVVIIIYGPISLVGAASLGPLKPFPGPHGQASGHLPVPQPFFTNGLGSFTRYARPTR